MSEAEILRMDDEPRPDGRAMRPLEWFLSETMPLLRQGRPDSEGAWPGAGCLPLTLRTTLRELLDVAIDAELRAAVLECVEWNGTEGTEARARRASALRAAARDIRASGARIVARAGGSAAAHGPERLSST